MSFVRAWGGVGGRGQQTNVPLFISCRFHSHLFPIETPLPVGIRPALSLARHVSHLLTSSNGSCHAPNSPRFITPPSQLEGKSLLDGILICHEGPDQHGHGVLNGAHLHDVGKVSVQKACSTLFQSLRASEVPYNAMREGVQIAGSA